MFCLIKEKQIFKVKGAYQMRAKHSEFYKKLTKPTKEGLVLSQKLKK